MSTDRPLPPPLLSISPEWLDDFAELVAERVAVQLAPQPQGLSETAINEPKGQLLYDEKLAAKVLGTSPIALKNERLQGRIEYLKRGRQVRYLPEHLHAYVESWKAGGSQGE